LSKSDDFWNRFRQMAEEQERLTDEAGGGLLFPDGVPFDVMVEELGKGKASVFWIATRGKRSAEEEV
jgi:hypothetical protein